MKTDAGLSGLSNEELTSLFFQAVALDARHPDFVDHSDDPNFEGDDWVDHDAEALFHEVMLEMISRRGGRFRIEFPGGRTVKIKPKKGR
jgi:hypothetical protein